MVTERILPNAQVSYISTLKSIPLLEEGETRRLLVQWRKYGDRDAREMLIKSYLRQVIKIVFTIKRGVIPFEDLIAEGILGLMRAIDGFDLERKNSLATYAQDWIRSYINEYIFCNIDLADRITGSDLMRTIYHNLGKRKAAEGIHRICSDYQIKKFALEFGATEEMTRRVDRILFRKTISLDNPLPHHSNSGKTTLLDILPGERDLEEELIEDDMFRKRRDILRKAIQNVFSVDGLNDRKRYYRIRAKFIFCARYLKNPTSTSQEIAKKLCVSRQCVEETGRREYRRVQNEMLRREEQIPCGDLRQCA